METGVIRSLRIRGAALERRIGSGETRMYAVFCPAFFG
jgi:hypothetical protein